MFHSVRHGLPFLRRYCRPVRIRLSQSAEPGQQRAGSSRSLGSHLRLAVRRPQSAFSLLTTRFANSKIWKRAAAEVIDFFLLLILKVFVTYGKTRAAIGLSPCFPSQLRKFLLVAIEYFDLIELEKYEINLSDTEFDPYQVILLLRSCCRAAADQGKY